MENAVGPILRMCDEVERVIRAIEDDNPDNLPEVIDRGAYVRIQAPGQLRLTDASLKRHLGAGYELRKLQNIMSSFAGRIRNTSDEILWYYETGPGGSIGAAAHSGARQ